MRVIEFFHDEDQPGCTNVDFWIKENKDYKSEKFLVNEKTEYPDFEDIDLILLHGGSQHLWDKDKDRWLYKEIEYIREALEERIPVIGFCLGSQIIAEALGGKVYLAEEKEVGWFNISIRLEAKGYEILKSLEKGFTSFLWHSDHYTIPETCSSLAFTEVSENQIIVCNTLPAVGFQFHPEYTKENILNYLETYDESAWSGGKYALGKEVFYKEMGKVPETYDLFKVLMDNTMNWFLRKG